MSNSKRLAKIGTAAIVMLGSVSSALADSVLLTCGPSSGYTYYMEGKKTDVGWKKDADGRLKESHPAAPRACPGAMVSASFRTYSGRIRACTGRARPCAAGKSHNY